MNATLCRWLIQLPIGQEARQVSEVRRPDRDETVPELRATRRVDPVLEHKQRRAIANTPSRNASRRAAPAFIAAKLGRLARALRSRGSGNRAARPTPPAGRRSPLTDANRDPLLTICLCTQLTATGGNSFGLSEPFSGLTGLPPVATGCPRSAPLMLHPRRRIPDGKRGCEVPQVWQGVSSPFP